MRAEKQHLHKTHVLEKNTSQLRLSKRLVESADFCKIVFFFSRQFSWDVTLPAGIPAGLVRAGQVADGQWEPGMICYGIPVGTDGYVLSKLNEKVSEVAAEIETVTEVLQDHHQALWTDLRSSTSHKLDHWLPLVYPSRLSTAAQRMDKLQMNVVKTILGMKIPLEGEGLG